MKYKVRWDYEARDWHGHMIKLRKGETVEIDESVATWVMADSPGVLHELSDTKQARLMEEPGEDRMVRHGAKRSD